MILKTFLLVPGYCYSFARWITVWKSLKTIKTIQGELKDFFSAHTSLPNETKGQSWEWVYWKYCENLPRHPWAINPDHSRWRGGTAWREDPWILDLGLFVVPQAQKGPKVKRWVNKAVEDMQTTWAKFTHHYGKKICMFFIC